MEQPDLESVRRELAREKLRNYHFSGRLVQAIALLFVFIASISCAALLLFYGLQKEKAPVSALEQTVQTLSMQRSAIESLKSDVVELKRILAIAPSNLPSTALETEQARQSRLIQTLDTRISLLETALTDKPEKMLSVPLLRKDFDEATRRAEERFLTSKVEIGRLHDELRWIYGGIGSVLIAVAGGSLTLFFRLIPRTEKTSTS